MAANTSIRGHDANDIPRNVLLDSQGRLITKRLTTLADIDKVSPSQVAKSVAATGTPERIVGSQDQNLFRRAWVGGFSSAQTANTGSVYLGTTATDGEQPLEIKTGEWKELKAPEGAKLDLYDLYVDVANANDGVVVVYW